MEADQQHLRAFLFNRMYRDYRTNRETSKARRVIAELFALFVAEPGLLPTEWQPQGPVSAAELARTVCDYIAGMTDRYALLEHQRLFAVSASL